MSGKSTGSTIRSEIKSAEEYVDVAKSIENALEGYANAIEPCDMCSHDERRGKLRDYEVCTECCYYYQSKFEYC